MKQIIPCAPLPALPLPPNQRTSRGTQKRTASHEKAIYSLKGVCRVREGSFAHSVLVIWGSSCGQLAYEFGLC